MVLRESPSSPLALAGLILADVYLSVLPHRHPPRLMIHSLQGFRGEPCSEPWAAQTPFWQRDPGSM